MLGFSLIQKLLAVAILLIVSLTLLPAQVPVYFDKISEEDGLGHFTVTCITQDSSGFLWFGTGDGLSRYDSHNFKSYKYNAEDSSSLRGLIIMALYVDRSGQLWVGSHGAGLNRYDHETERFFHYANDINDETTLSSNHVSSIYEDQSGNLWVGTEGGLNLLDRETGTFVRYMHDPTVDTSISHNTVYDIQEDSWGNLWIATYGGGLNRFERETGRFFQSTGPEPIWVRIRDGDTVYKLRNLDGERWGVEVFDLARDPDETQSLFEPDNAEHEAFAARLRDYKRELVLGFERAGEQLGDDESLEQLQKLGYIRDR